MEQLNVKKILQEPSPSSRALAIEEETRRAECAKAATILLGCYKTTDVNDPKTFLAGAAAVLARFGPEVAFAVADPANGLPSKLKWFPSISELREACEAEAIHQDTIRRLGSLPPAVNCGPLLTNVDPCNLLVRRGRRGFQEMLDAKEQGKIEHLRWDDNGADGIHVNHAEYGQVVGFLRK